MTRVGLFTNLCTHYRRPVFERLAQQFDMEFYFTSSGGEWYWPSAHGLSSGELRAVREHRAPALARIVARGGYDCVIAGLGGRGTFAATVAAARATRVPLVLWTGIWEHPATPFHRLSRPLASMLYRSADALVVYGPHVARHVADESGRTENVFEAPQAVDNGVFRAPPSPERRQALRAELGLGLAPVACFVGRLEPEKGLETLVRALAASRVEQQLLVVGSGGFEDELRRLVRELALDDGRVRFAGYVEQRALVDYLAVCDYLVLPSVTTSRFREPWGLVANEAMNAALPVVATEAVGAVAGGLVVHDVTGLVVPERDEEALAAALDALAQDEALRRRLGASASARVLRWSFDAAAAGFASAIESAIARREVRRARPARA